MGEGGGVGFGGVREPACPWGPLVDLKIRGWVSQASLLVPPRKRVLFLSLAKLTKVKIQLNNSFCKMLKKKYIPHESTVKDHGSLFTDSNGRNQT